MAWYRAGTVTVANGSPTVTGAGTDFVSNTQVGEVFLGPDGRVYEIAAVVSATQLTIIPAYLGATGGGQAYGLQPTASFARDLALAAGQLLNGFASVRDGIGQGLISDGSQAAPGIRFAADQDTGIRRHVGNGLALVAGGVDRLTVDTGGVAITGSAQVAAADFPNLIIVKNGFNAWFLGGSGNAGDNDFTIRLGPSSSAFRINTDGNLLVGTTAHSCHYISRAVSEGAAILEVGRYGTGSVAIFSCTSAGASSAATGMAVPRNSGTGRSINAGGTINASGADYAEYMTKAAGCGTIAAGDVCGVDKDGHLTRTWADAVSFVVKSTDPAYVGGDTWAANVAPKPDKPGAALTAWEAALEAERVKVDRIAFCGQVPVNVTGNYAVGDYLIAAANASGIKAVAVPEADITFDQYRRRLGKVWAVRDGRAWVDVQHG